MMSIERRQPASLARGLERHRLQRRVARVEQVLAALELRALEHRRHRGRVNAPLGSAIADFDRELVAIRQRLVALEEADGHPLRP